MIERMTIEREQDIALPVETTKTHRRIRVPRRAFTSAIFTKECTTLVRRPACMRAFGFITIGMIITGLLVLASNWPGEYAYENMVYILAKLANQGKALITALFFAEAVASLLVLPAIAGSAIAGERERHTFEFLLITPLTEREIVVGKILSSVAFITLIQLCALPFAALAFMLGGVSPLQLLICQAIILTLGLALAAIGLYCSSWCRTTIAGVVMAYIACVLWVVPWDFWHELAYNFFYNLPEIPIILLIYFAISGMLTGIVARATRRMRSRASRVTLLAIILVLLVVISWNVCWAFDMSTIEDYLEVIFYCLNPFFGILSQFFQIDYYLPSNPMLIAVGPPVVQLCGFLLFSYLAIRRVRMLRFNEGENKGHIKAAASGKQSPAIAAQEEPRREKPLSVARMPLLTLLPYKFGIWLDSPILMRAGRARLWGAGVSLWQRVMRVLAALIIFFTIICMVISAYTESGDPMMVALLMGEGIICAILIPALAGGAIANEHEKRTLEPLLITPLSSTQIVLGKVLAAMCPALLIQMLCLPILLVTPFFEEYSPWLLVAAQLVLLSMTLAVAAISVFTSSVCRNTVTGVIAAVGACLLWLLPIPCFVRIQLWLLMVLLLFVVITTWFPRMIAVLLMQPVWPIRTRTDYYRIKLVTMIIVSFITTVGLFFLFVPDSWDEVSGIVLANPFVGIYSLFDTINYYRYGIREDLRWINSYLAPLAVIVQLLTAYVAVRLTVLRLDSLRNGPRDPMETERKASA